MTTASHHYANFYDDVCWNNGGMCQCRSRNARHTCRQRTEGYSYLDPVMMVDRRVAYTVSTAACTAAISATLRAAAGADAVTGAIDSFTADFATCFAASFTNLLHAKARAHIHTHTYDTSNCCLRCLTVASMQTQTCMLRAPSDMDNHPNAHITSTYRLSESEIPVPEVSSTCKSATAAASICTRNDRAAVRHAHKEALRNNRSCYNSTT
jgi:hypothetical protein